MIIDKFETEDGFEIGVVADDWGIEVQSEDTMIFTPREAERLAGSLRVGAIVAAKLKAGGGDGVPIPEAFRSRVEELLAGK